MAFPAEEYRARVERAQQLMRRDRVDALLLTSEAHFGYFGGYVLTHPWTTYSRTLWALVPRRGEPTLILPRFLADDAERESWVSGIRTYTRYDRADVELVRDTLADRGLAGGRIGLELGAEQRLNLSPDDAALLRRELGAAELVDAAPMLWELRMRKSPLELEQIRRACRATGAGLAAAFSAPRAGCSERELAGIANAAALAQGADQTGFVCATSGRGQYGRLLGHPRERRLEPGDLFWLDLGVRATGYYSDYCRAGVVGGPSDEQQRLQAAIVEATWTGIRAVGPGVPVAEVARAALAARDEIGLPILYTGRVGHGIGLASTEPPSVALSDDPTVLETGMVICIEPYVSTETAIYCCEEIVAVTEDGHEVLSTAPRELAAI